MRRFASLLLLASLSLASAQVQNDPDKTGVAALPTPDGALLRWYLPGDVLPTGGFVVQVTDSGSTRSVPVASPQPFSSALGVSREEYDALQAIYSGPAPSDSTRVQRAIFNLNVVARPAFARTLGILTTLRGLTPGRHTATVYAVAAGGQIRVGEATFATGPTPAVPTPGALKVTTGPSAAQVTWTPPASSAASLVVSYNVYRAPETGGFALLDPAPFFRSSDPGGDVFKDSTLKPGTTYRYRVTAVDLFGRESLPTPPITLSLRDNGPLVSPEIARATSTNRAVTLEWIPGDDPRVKTLLVLRGTGPENLAVVGRVPVAATRYTDASVLGGTPYLYALAAADASGQATGRSTMTSANGLNLTPPATPTGLNMDSGENALTLKWAANREQDLLGYWVYRAEGQQSSAEEVLLTGHPINTTEYVDRIPQGVQTRYHYRVVAINSSQVESAPSAQVTAALLDKTPPPSPVISSVKGQENGVTVAWEQAEVPDLSRFEVTRTQNGGAVGVLGSVGAAARTLTDITAQPGLLYTYAVVSLDQVGNRSAPSQNVQASRPLPAVSSAHINPHAVLLPESQGVRLNWTPGGPALYVVYRLNGTQPVQVSDLLGEPTFTDPQGESSSQYQLRIVDVAGEFGPPTPPFGPVP